MEMHDYDPEEKLLNQLTLEQLLWNLKPIERMILLEYYIFERPVAELQKRYGLATDRAVKNRVYTIVHKLRKKVNL